MIHKAFIAFVFLLAVELPGNAVAQFSLKSLDPSRLGDVLQSFGEQGGKVVQVLEKPDAQKAVVEALHSIEPAKAEAAANTIRAAATTGGWVAGQGSATTSDGSRSQVEAPTKGSSDLPVPARASHQQPVKHLLQKDAIQSLGSTISKGSKLLDKKSSHQKQEARGDALAVAAILQNDMPKATQAIAGFLRDARLRKDLEATLKRETPKLTQSLKQVDLKEAEELLSQVDLKEAEELLKHANAKEIHEALHLLHEYHWWRAHWSTVAAAVVSVCISVVVLSVIFRKLFLYRVDKHSPTVELSMWLPRRQAECLEAGFRQF